MGLKNKCRRRAFSSVISALILSTVVLVVGGGLWMFSQGAMTLTSENYAEDVIELTDTISERFIIEQVVHDGTHLFVWIFNYGEVDIEVKVNVGAVTYPENWIDIAANEVLAVDPEAYAASTGDELNIKTFTRRENNAYYRFIVP